MAVLATSSQQGNARVWTGGSGVNTTDVVIQTKDSMRYDQHQLMSTAGAMQVFVSLDGTNFTTAPLSLIDQGAITSAPVLATVAGRLYGFVGYFAAIQVQQVGATAVANASLVQSPKFGPT
jgi:hypothetical protein